MIAVCCFFCTLFQRAIRKIISVINESNNLDITLIVASPPPIIAPPVGPVRCGAGIRPDPSRIVVASSILAVVRLAPDNVTQRDATTNEWGGVKRGGGAG